MRLSCCSNLARQGSSVILFCFPSVVLGGVNDTIFLPDSRVVLASTAVLGRSLTHQIIYYDHVHTQLR
jgi:hypothetical protein